MSEQDIDYTKDKDWWLSEYPKRIQELQRNIHRLETVNKALIEQLANGVSIQTNLMALADGESYNLGHRKGWEQAKNDIRSRISDLAFKDDGEWIVFELSLKRDIDAMEYKEKV